MHNFLIGILLLFPIAAQANVVWPALYLETRLFSWWAISVGLLVEYVFVRELLSASPLKALLATITANVASAILGILLIPLAGIAWEVFPGLLFYHVFNMGTFNPITWCATFIMACAINVALEGLVYKKVFKFGFIIKSRLFFWFMLANAASVGIAAASLLVHPVQP